MGVLALQKQFRRLHQYEQARQIQIQYPEAFQADQEYHVCNIPNPI